MSASFSSGLIPSRSVPSGTSTHPLLALPSTQSSWETALAGPSKPHAGTLAKRRVHRPWAACSSKSAFSSNWGRFVQKPAMRKKQRF